MIKRLDALPESRTNPLTGQSWDDSWIILRLTDSGDYQKMCGSSHGSAYTIRISRSQCRDWAMAVGDCISFHEAEGKHVLLVMAAEELACVQAMYAGHSFRDPFLRGGEPDVLVHSTGMGSWKQIQQDGMLKSWQRLKDEGALAEAQPIGIHLGDPADFSRYIMFGSGVTGEIVVCSKQRGQIVMDVHAEYETGARLYFDAQKMARDGLLLRDGCHLKVRDTLPLRPYLIWAATWDGIGLPSQRSTPQIFSEQADRQFERIFADEKG